MSLRTRALLATSALGLAAAPRAAHAQTACATLPNPVVVSGSTAIRPLIQRVAPLLAAAAGDAQLTVVYSASGSCAGVSALASDATPAGACASGACVTGTGNYWDAAGMMHACNLAASGTHIDVALSDVFAQSCAGADVSHLTDTSLLVIPFEFIVPHASGQTALDVREAYFAYGFGAAGMVTPWTNEALLFRRDALSGTQITVARAIHVPETRFLGVDAMSGGNMLTRVAAASDPEAAVGFLGTDTGDAHRDTVTGLAYRHWGQNSYYWPDSRRDAFDKRNVRDGHYPLWGYEHAVTQRDAAGAPVSARGEQLAQVLSGQRALADADLVQLTVATNLVPLCAMEVSRATDGGDFSVLELPEPCGCYFDATVPMGSTTCASCTSDATCGAGHCRRGYCESR
jgi:hypothetical protein